MSSERAAGAQDGGAVPLEANGRLAARGAIVAVYGARSSGNTPAVASSLARALAALDVGSVALAELDPRALRARAERVLTQPAPPSADQPLRRRSANGDRSPPPHAGAVSRRLAPDLKAWLVRGDDGVWVLAASGRPRSPGLPDAKSVGNALEALRQLVLVGVVELERQVNERTLAGLDAAERVMLVTRGSVASLRGTQRILRLCRRLNYPDEKLCVIVVPSDAPGSLGASDIAAALRRAPYWTIPDSGARGSYAGLAGRLVAELRESAGG